jgi:hypothetical protein
MRQIAAVIALVGIVVLTGVAHATTLTVSQGSVDIGGTDTFATFSGDGFSVSLTYPYAVSGKFGGSITVPLAVGLGGGITIQVDGTSCTQSSTPPCAGSMTLESPLLPKPPPDWPNNVNFITTAPFTATGFFNVGGGEFDFVGQGTLTGFVCFNFRQFPCSFGALPGPTNSLYAFSIPEPSALLLLVTSLGVLGARPRWVHSRRPGSAAAP